MSAAPGPAADDVDWGQLYMQHRETMYRVAVRCLRGARRSDVEAEDLVHSAFTSVMRNPPEQVDDWERFLIAVTARRFQDYLRSTDHRNTNLTIDNDSTPREPASVEDTADAAIRRIRASTARDRLARALDGLTARQQEIARLLLFEGLTTGTIAARLGTSSANVSQLAKKVLSELAEALLELDSIQPADIERLRPTRRRPGGAA